MAEIPSAASILPAQTQGYVRVINMPRFLERFEATELGAMGKVPGMWEFWEEQKQGVETRLAEAGWQMNLHPQDVYDTASGQVALAWISRPNEIRKPYAVALVMDVEGREDQTQKLLSRIEKELTGRQAKKESIQHSGKSITKFTMPLKPGELLVQESHYAVVGSQLIASDDLTTIKSMIDGSISGSLPNSLLTTDAFKQSQSRLQGEPANDDVEYFVRPIGMARVLRSITKKPSGRQADVLQVLENQGFGKIAAALGRIRILDDKYDVYHQGFVLAPGPLPKAVQILDFPNTSSHTIPGWVASSAASFSSMAWNLKDAFWKVEGLVDDMAGQKDTFKLLIEGIQTDPLGPQIDIRNEVMPCLTDEIYTIADCVQPIGPESKRSLIAVRVNFPDKFLKVIERIMKDEPNAELLDFEGKRIWKVTNPADDEISDVDLSGFGDFNSKKNAKQKAEAKEEPWLNNWAITVHDGFLMFSSHHEFIQETIQQGKIAKEASKLTTEADFARAMAAVQNITGSDPNCLWHVNRADRAFQMQYELFRQDKLPQSKSMLASIMDRLLRPKSEVKSKVQKVKGDKLPPYDQIREYLMPSGMVIRSEKEGWLIRSFVLPAENRKPANVAEKTAQQSVDPSVNQVVVTRKSLEAPTVTPRIIVAEEQEEALNISKP